MPDPNDSSALETRYPAEPPVFTYLNGVAFTLCNASKSRVHTLEGVTVHVKQFEPYAGRLQT